MLRDFNFWPIIILEIRQSIAFVKQLTLNIQNKFRTRYFLNAGASVRINERKLETLKIIF